MLVNLFQLRIFDRRKHSSRMCTTRLPTVRVLVATTRCQWWGGWVYQVPGPEAQEWVPIYSGHTQPWGTLPMRIMSTPSPVNRHTPVKTLPSRNFEGYYSKASSKYCFVLANLYLLSIFAKWPWKKGTNRPKSYNFWLKLIFLTLIIILLEFLLQIKWFFKFSFSFLNFKLCYGEKLV